MVSWVVNVVITSYEESDRRGRPWADSRTLFPKTSDSTLILLSSVVDRYHSRAIQSTANIPQYHGTTATMSVERRCSGVSCSLFLVILSWKLFWGW